MVLATQRAVRCNSGTAATLCALLTTCELERFQPSSHHVYGTGRWTGTGRNTTMADASNACMTAALLRTLVLPNSQGQAPCQGAVLGGLIASPHVGLGGLLQQAGGPFQGLPDLLLDILSKVALHMQ